MAPLCEIKFENSISDGAVFWCGQILRCTVILNLVKPKKVKGIYVTISGQAMCQWSERNGKKNFKGKEQYINSVTYLIGNINSDTVELPAGNYTHSFVYPIPSSVPSSIEGNEGHIRYNLTVTINRPFPHSDIHFQANLTFVKPFDLNTIFYILSIPFQKYTNHTFYCFLCRSAPFKIVATIPQTGYVPGEIIKINILANNGSNVTIRATTSSLCQNITYLSQSSRGKRVQINKLTKLLATGIPAKQTRNYELEITVPPVVATDQQFSDIIKVTYFIKLCFETNWLHSSPSMEIPIIIGTIPIATINAQPI